MWERAASEWDALTRPHRAAYARWRQAEALLAHPAGRTAAVEVLRTAARQAAQHIPLSMAIHDLARRARIDLTITAESPDAQPSTATPTPFGLTGRELAVLRLLAEGRTNSEIGAKLYISRKTASVHVTNILRKLNVTTRVQAAAVAERRWPAARRLNSYPRRAADAESQRSSTRCPLRERRVVCGASATVHCGCLVHESVHKTAFSERHGCHAQVQDLQVWQGSPPRC
jgi:DNA-binding CsgD family transcriptional regulator